MAFASWAGASSAIAGRVFLGVLSVPCKFTIDLQNSGLGVGFRRIQQSLQVLLGCASETYIPGLLAFKFTKRSSDSGP